MHSRSQRHIRIPEIYEKLNIELWSILTWSSSSPSWNIKKSLYALKKQKVDSEP